MSLDDILEQSFKEMLPPPIPWNMISCNYYSPTQRNRKARCGLCKQCKLYSLDLKLFISNDYWSNELLRYLIAHNLLIAIRTITSDLTGTNIQTLPTLVSGHTGSSLSGYKTYDQIIKFFNEHDLD